MVHELVAGQDAQGRLIPPKQTARHAGISIVGTSRFRVFDEGRPNLVERLADHLRHLGTKFTTVVIVAIVCLDGSVKGFDHRHRGISTAEKPRPMLYAAGTIDLVAGASLFEHRGCGDELVEERRLCIGERCCARVRRQDREQHDG